MSKVELVHKAQTFVTDMQKTGIALDYSVASLGAVELFLQKTVPTPGKPKAQSYFVKDTDLKVFAMGCYLGEVVRRNTRAVKWSSADAESPVEITLVNPEGGTHIINKTFKRFYEGDADNIQHFAAVLLKEYFRFDGDIPADFLDDEDQRIIDYADSPICYYSKLIKQQGLPIRDVVYKHDVWIFLTGDEKGLEATDLIFDLMFLSEIKARHPELADLLVSDDKIRIVRQDDGNYKAQTQHEGLFFGEGSMATSQGDMKLNVFQWTKMNPWKITKITGVLLLSLLLAIKVNGLFGIIFVGSVLYNIWYWFSTYNRFKGGDMNPGKVVSINPVLIAVATDMGKHSENFPILSIIETRLPKEDRAIGKIIPTIALYNDNPHNYPFWAKFNPVPVIHGVSDRKQIDQLKSGFSRESIETLDARLKQILKVSPGVYKIDEKSSGWKKYPHVDLNKGVDMAGPDDAKN